MPLYPPEAGVSRLAQGGIYLMQYAVVDGSGYPQYNNGAISQGTARGMIPLIATKKGGGQGPAPRKINWSGDNGYYRASLLLPPAELSVLDATFAVFDLNFHAVMSNTKIQQIGQWNAYVGETNARSTARQLCIIETSDAVDADTGSFGPQRYSNWIYPVCWGSPMYAVAEEANPATWEVQISVTQANKFPWGDALSVLNNGATRAARQMIPTYYPLTMDTFISDGATTSFSLSWTPASDFTGSDIRVYRNGVFLAGSSIVVGTKQVTLPSAGTAGDVNVVVYEAFDILVS